MPFSMISRNGTLPRPMLAAALLERAAEQCRLAVGHNRRDAMLFVVRTCQAVRNLCDGTPRGDQTPSDHDAPPHGFIDATDCIAAKAQGALADGVPSHQALEVQILVRSLAEGLAGRFTLDRLHTRMRQQWKSECHCAERQWECNYDCWLLSHIGGMAEMRLCTPCPLENPAPPLTGEFRRPQSAVL